MYANFQVRLNIGLGFTASGSRSGQRRSIRENGTWSNSFLVQSCAMRLVSHTSFYLTNDACGSSSGLFCVRLIITLMDRCSLSKKATEIKISKIRSMAKQQKCQSGTSFDRCAAYPERIANTHIKQDAFSLLFAILQIDAARCRRKRSITIKFDPRAR